MYKTAKMIRIDTIMPAVAAIPVLMLLVPNVNVNAWVDDDANPYCDLLSDEERRDVTCHDRKDYSDTTGLYICNDSSHVQDWRDCPDVSGYDYGNYFPEAGTQEFNDIKDCVDDGYKDGLNHPFNADRHEECDRFSYLPVNPYYDAFINGCQSVEGNTEEDCERNIE